MISLIGRCKGLICRFIVTPPVKNCYALYISYLYICYISLYACHICFYTRESCYILCFSSSYTPQYIALYIAYPVISTSYRTYMYILLYTMFYLRIYLGSCCIKLYLFVDLLYTYYSSYEQICLLYFGIRVYTITMSYDEWFENHYLPERSRIRPNIQYTTNIPSYRASWSRCAGPLPRTRTHRLSITIYRTCLNHEIDFNETRWE